jgi:hypothetical protein
VGYREGQMLTQQIARLISHVLEYTRTRVLFCRLSCLLPILLHKCSSYPHEIDLSSLKVTTMDLVTATDLGRWAELRDAQAWLPQVIRRLISSTANGLISISVRAGEGVQLPGWDSVVRAQHADAHVPAGISVWE